MFKWGLKVCLSGVICSRNLMREMWSCSTKYVDPMENIVLVRFKSVNQRKAFLTCWILWITKQLATSFWRRSLLAKISFVPKTMRGDLKNASHGQIWWIWYLHAFYCLLRVPFTHFLSSGVGAKPILPMPRFRKRLLLQPLPKLFYTPTPPRYHSIHPKPPVHLYLTVIHPSNIFGHPVKCDHAIMTDTWRIDWLSS